MLGNEQTLQPEASSGNHGKLFWLLHPGSFWGRRLCIRKWAASEPHLDLHKDRHWLAVILNYSVEETGAAWRGDAEEHEDGPLGKQWSQEKAYFSNIQQFLVICVLGLLHHKNWNTARKCTILDSLRETSLGLDTCTLSWVILHFSTELTAEDWIVKRYN